MKTAYITGATGCVGRNLVDVLLEDGWKIIVLHRASSDLSRLDGCSVEFREVDLHKYRSVENALDVQANAIFHAAANVSHNPRYHKAQYKDNVIATDNLVTACVRNKVAGRFIFTSTGACTRGDGLDINQLSELKSGYIRTKKLSEMVVQQTIKTDGLDAVILRPIIIVGRYDWNNYSRIFGMLKAGKLKNSIPGYLHFCHAKDIARGHLLAFERGRPGEIYYLGGEFTSWHDFCIRACKLMGVKPPWKPMALWTYYIVARFMMWRQRWFDIEAEITPELVDLMSTVSEDTLPQEEKDKTREELGYESAPLDEAMRECYDWMVEEGMI